MPSPVVRRLSTAGTISDIKSLLKTGKFFFTLPHKYDCTMALKDIKPTGQKDTRSGFGDGIVEAGKSNPNIIALTADLLGSMKLNQFIKEFPDRFIQCG